MKEMRLDKILASSGRWRPQRSKKADPGGACAGGWESGTNGRAEM